MSATAGHLMIAAAPAISTYVLPELLERFVAAHPRVEVSVRTGHSENVVELVLHDEVQIGLGRAIHHPDLELRPFHTEDLVLVCAPDHPFTRRSSVAMAEVAGQKPIMFDRTSSYYEITQATFLSRGVSLRGLMELDSIEAVKKMVERGLGIALLPGSAVAREAAGGTLCVVRMKDAPPMQNTIVAYRRRDSGQPTGIVAAFLDLLEAR
jgi:DNA-binding transcriptional LysR family regulator